jgi:hypothetical protein
MATITTILGSDSPADSRTDINDNFTAVNVELVAATSAVAGKENSGTAAAAVAAHVAAGDPHTQYALESDVTTALAAKVNAASPTFTGPITSTGAVITEPSVMLGTEIDVTKRRNTYSATGNATLTFSATPVTGTEFGVEITCDGSARTISFPESESVAQGGSVTSAIFPASLTTTVLWRKTETGYLILGDPPTAAQGRAALGLAAIASSGSASDLSTGTLPADRIGSGSALQIVRRNAGNTALEFVDPTSSGDVSAASAFATDNRVIRSDGTVKGVQASSVQIDDDGNIGPVSDSIPNHVAFWDGHATAPKVIRFTAPLAITTEYNIIWPAAPGTAGQALRVASVAGSTLTMEFYTP